MDRQVLEENAWYRIQWEEGGDWIVCRFDGYGVESGSQFWTDALGVDYWPRQPVAVGGKIPSPLAPWRRSHAP